MTNAVLLMVILTATSIGPDSSIVTRHDRPDSAYLELGARFPAVAHLGGRMGDGTLIGDRWILTAAHVARGMRERNRGTVELNGLVYHVADYFIHPDWTDMGPHDMALLRLNTPVSDVEPVPLYRRSDEIGALATIVGHGATGTGDSRERTEDGRRRGATNVIDEANLRFIVFTFDAPPDGTDLEGIPGPGDSGGPAFIEIAGRPHVAGVSSLGEPGSNGPGTYGARDYFGRVSTHLAWIDEVMTGRTAATVAPAVTVEIPDTPSGHRVAALLDLARSNPGLDDVTAFVVHNMAAEQLESRSASSIAEAWMPLLNGLSAAVVTAIGRTTPDQTDVILRTPGGDMIFGVRVEGTAPYGIDGVFSGRP